MEVLGKISTFMIHDLKNLVHTLSLVLSNAREHIANPDFQQDMLASLDNTTGRMNTLIGKFKNMPDKSSLQTKPADLQVVVSQVAGRITGPEIQILGGAAAVLIDREQIQNVALNLILNAIDATDGTGPVWVETGTDNGRAYIIVRDEGCGIPEEFLRQHLFSPFKTTKKTGLGIGLYQCRQIVEAHNGRIEAASEVGRGTIFTVWLPLVKP
jgi:putative PEP-CTERM system histidine kinase